MKKLLYLFIILMILFKTGNVLSDQSIFTVNNLKINKKTYKNNKDLTDIAFTQGFIKLNKKILLEKDFKKIKNTNIKTIKNLISHYQILNNKNKKTNDFIEFNLYFKRDKLYNFYYKNDVKYSDISGKDLEILPILVMNNEILIYKDNFFYNNWNNLTNNYSIDQDLIEYILPLENIELLDHVKKYKNNLESIELSKIFDEFKEKNNLFIIINYDKKVVKVFIKGIISEKKIIKNLKFEIIDDQESSSFDKILIKLKKEIFELIKSQNIIDIRTPSFLNVSLIMQKQNDLLVFQNLLNEIDLIENFNVKEFNNIFADIKIKYYGKINKITEKLEEKGLSFQVEGELWKVRVN